MRDAPDGSAQFCDPEPTASQAAILKIVEEFRRAHLEVLELRAARDAMTPAEVARRVAALEDELLNRIAALSDAYQARSSAFPSH
jgi:hypothetical protein